MSDGNLNKWKAYESLENVPVPEKIDWHNFKIGGVYDLPKWIY